MQQNRIVCCPIGGVPFGEFVRPGESQGPIQNTITQTTNDRVIGSSEQQMNPFNPQPFNPQPFNPQPFNPQPFNPQPFNPQPFNPQPFNPQPLNPQSFNPKPVSPQSFNAQPFVSQPFNPQPANKQPFIQQPFNQQASNRQPSEPQLFNNQQFNPQPFLPQTFIPRPFMQKSIMVNPINAETSLNPRSFQVASPEFPNPQIQFFDQQPFQIRLINIEPVQRNVRRISVPPDVKCDIETGKCDEEENEDIDDDCETPSEQNEEEDGTKFHLNSAGTNIYPSYPMYIKPGSNHYLPISSGSFESQKKKDEDDSKIYFGTPQINNNHQQHFLNNFQHLNTMVNYNPLQKPTNQQQRPFNQFPSPNQQYPYNPNNPETFQNSRPNNNQQFIQMPPPNQQGNLLQQNFNQRPSGGLIQTSGMNNENLDRIKDQTGSLNDRQTGTCLQRCTTPNNVLGVCISIRQCSSIVKIVPLSIRNSTISKYLRESGCGFEGAGPLVCCPVGTTPFDRQPDSPQTNPPLISLITSPQIPEPINSRPPAQPFDPQLFLPPTTTTSPATPRPVQVSQPVSAIGPGMNCGRRYPKEDGEQTFFISVVGGKDAVLGDWPWAAALGYRGENGNPKPRFLCGGALITKTHVLTAAHCVAHRSDLYLVRLGEIDLANDVDSAVDIEILRSVVHDQYDRRKRTSDIAILTLAREAPDNFAIHQICLPSLSHEITIEQKQLWAIGWGALQYEGNTSTILQEVPLPYVKEEPCKSSYAAFPNQVIDSRTICAGYPEGEKDVCSGDSGGPLMLKELEDGKPTYYVVGVVAYGFRCAEPGYPGVYTRVTSFLPWIMANIL